MYEDRIEKAKELFSEGYNCAQSVVAAWADMYGVDKETALRMSCGFGGGMGRMRMTCGAACGLFVLAGLENGITDGADRLGKASNYQLVQKLADDFRKEMGSLTCADLLGLNKPEGTHIPEERTEKYYQKRPCKEIVATAARIYANYLEHKPNKIIE